MDKRYHSVIISGGCLGASTAISIAQMEDFWNIASGSKNTLTVKNI